MLEQIEEIVITEKDAEEIDFQVMVDDLEAKLQNGALAGESLLLYTLMFFAALSNLVFLWSSSRQALTSHAYLFLAHLALADICHTLHGLFFFTNSPRPVLAHRRQDDLQSWSSTNQFLGLVTCTASVVALTSTAFLEILRTLTKKQPEKQNVWSVEEGKHSVVSPKTEKLKVFLGTISIWTLTVVICSIVLYQVNYCSLLPLEEHQNWSAPKFFGVQCNLHPPSTYPLKLWMTIFELLMNPLWFPLACFSSLPVIVFVAINNELWSPAIETTESRTIADRFRSAGASRKSLWCIMAMFYALFIYDLMQFSKKTFGATGSEVMTGSNVMTGNDIIATEVNDVINTQTWRLPDRSLQVVYLSFHWTRPLATLLRNAFIAVMERPEKGFYYRLVKNT